MSIGGEANSESGGLFSYERYFQQQADIIAQLRQAVGGALHIADVNVSERGDWVMFIGRLALEAEAVYAGLRERFRPLGYTPMLRREGPNDLIVAHRGVPGAARFNPIINLALLIATVLTTLLGGMGIAGEPVGPALRAVLDGDWLQALGRLAAGAPFAFTLLFILFVHEMGHYLAARYHGVQVSLPYFIPAPLGLGTFGAFIQLKSPVENRKMLFDVGLAGPIAGFVVAVPLMIAGLLQSEVVTAAGGRVGTSLLVRWLLDVVVPHQPWQAVALSPMAVAAWFGLLITGFNLLPMGQLDGGHVAYAALGRWARPLSQLAFVSLLGLGFYWNGWWLWAFFVMFTGLRHAGPLNDITPLDWPRRLAALATIGLFILVITPKPF